MRTNDGGEGETRRKGKVVEDLDFADGAQQRLESMRLNQSLPRAPSQADNANSSDELIRGEGEAAPNANAAGDDLLRRYAELNNRSVLNTVGHNSVVADTDTNAAEEAEEAKEDDEEYISLVATPKCPYPKVKIGDHVVVWICDYNNVFFGLITGMFSGKIVGFDKECKRAEIQFDYPYNNIPNTSVGYMHIYMPDDEDSINAWLKASSGDNYITPGEAPRVRSSLLRLRIEMPGAVSNVRDWLTNGFTQACTQLTQFTQGILRRDDMENDNGGDAESFGDGGGNLMLSNDEGGDAASGGGGGNSLPLLQVTYPPYNNDGDESSGGLGLGHVPPGGLDSVLGVVGNGSGAVRFTALTDVTADTVEGGEEIPITNIFRIYRSLSGGDVNKSIYKAGEMHAYTLYRAHLLGELISAEEIEARVLSLEHDMNNNAEEGNEEEDAETSNPLPLSEQYHLYSPGNDFGDVDTSMDSQSIPEATDLPSRLQNVATVLGCPIHVFSDDARVRAIVPSKSTTIRSIMHLHFDKENSGHLSYMVPLIASKLNQAINGEDVDGNDFWRHSFGDGSKDVLSLKEIKKRHIVVVCKGEKREFFWCGGDGDLPYTQSEFIASCNRVAKELGPFNTGSYTIKNAKTLKMSQNAVKEVLRNVNYFRNPRTNASDSGGYLDKFQAAGGNSDEAHEAWDRAGRTALQKVKQDYRNKNGGNDPPAFGSSSLTSTKLYDVLNDQGKKDFGLRGIGNARQCFMLFNCSHSNPIEGTNAPISLGHLDSLQTKWWSNPMYVEHMPNPRDRTDAIESDGFYGISPNRAYPDSFKLEPINPHIPEKKYEDKDCWLHTSFTRAVHFSLFHDAARVHNYGKLGAEYGDVMFVSGFHPNDCRSVNVHVWTKAMLDLGKSDRSIRTYVGWMIIFPKDANKKRLECAKIIKCIDNYHLCEYKEVDLDSINLAD